MPLLSTNLTIIDDDDVYELLEVMVWLSSHELLLSPEEIFDLWAVEDSHGAPDPSPFPAHTDRVGARTGISGFDYRPDRPYMCQIGIII